MCTPGPEDVGVCAAPLRLGSADSHTMQLRATFALFFGALAAFGPWTASARAQSEPLESQSYPYPFDSGWLQPAPGASGESVLASTTLLLQGARWVRLRFQAAQLAPGARLRIASLIDGAVQELDGVAAQHWAHTSAYFNGDGVQLELVAEPGAGPSRVVLHSLWAPPQSITALSICGAQDDRTLSSDARLARLLPVGCTGWIFDDPARCMSTAGHCATTELQVAQFQVPLSDVNGAMQHPPPEHQYAVDPASVQRRSAGLGMDWAYFGCFPNSNSALTPHQTQQAAFTLAAAPVAAQSAVRVTGYGVDFDSPSASRAQQTHLATLDSQSGSILRHTADTTGGNSGSPILHELSGAVIGVHTHGGCNPLPNINANSGTALHEPAWVAARASPTGVCQPSASVASYCTSKINSLGCMPALSHTGAPSASGGPGSFTVHATSLLNGRLSFMMISALPRATAFQGGVLCVAPPRRRTPPGSSGGTAAGLDCSGVLSLDLGALIAAGNDPRLAYGAIAYVQCWSRDPLDPNGSSLTNGLRITIGP